MPMHTTIATAGNVLPSAFACLRNLGYVVTEVESSNLCKAEKGSMSFVAEDPLLLLGLIKLYEMRGDNWRPSDKEIEVYLAFDNSHGAGPYGG